MAAGKGVKLPFQKTRGGISIRVKVLPRSSRTKVEADGDAVRVWLTAPPADNAANEQLIEVLAEAFGVRKSAVRIARGRTSRQKVVEIDGVGGQ